MSPQIASAISVSPIPDPAREMAHRKALFVEDAVVGQVVFRVVGDDLAAVDDRRGVESAAILRVCLGRREVTHDHGEIPEAGSVEVARKRSAGSGAGLLETGPQGRGPSMG